MFIQTPVIEPMTIVGVHCINLHNFGSYRYLYLFNGIEHEQSQPAVKAIQVYYIREMYVFSDKLMVCFRMEIILKRIGVCPQTIVTDI